MKTFVWLALTGFVAGSTADDDMMKAPYDWSSGSVELPTTSYTESDWPVFGGKKRIFLCESCQSTVYVAMKKIKEDQEKTKSAEFGGYDIAVEELCDGQGICKLRDQWAWMADHAEVYTVSDLMDFCQGLLERREEELVSALTKRRPLEETIKNLCYTDLKVCAEESLWTSDDLPHLRTPKLERMSNLSNQFLEANQKRENVKVTESGLQYEVLQQGRPIEENETEVEVRYNATWINGHEFDRVLESKVVRLDKVIPGMQEGIKLAGVKGHIILAIPPKLAFGNDGSSRLVPPGAAVLYNIQILMAQPSTTPQNEDGMDMEDNYEDSDDVNEYSVEDYDDHYTDLHDEL